METEPILFYSPSTDYFDRGTPLLQDATLDSFPSISTETPYTAGAGSKLTYMSNKFSLSPDPQQWGLNLSPDFLEPDDELHNPDAKSDTRLFDYDGFSLNDRGVANVGCLLLVISGILTLFAGYPIITYFKKNHVSNHGGYNIGGINASGQIPQIIGNFGLIDNDTPIEAYSKPSWNDGSEMDLVFSDEFNTPGRTFWPGDDPYWEAANLHYWATNDLEWYDPSAIVTEGGYLVITMSKQNIHNLDYQSGMLSTWNKFCFTGGYIETSVSLPGVNNVVGLWPSVWTLGNLGRAGYGATLDGLWPYSYDACDVGTVANQTINGQPVAATMHGDPDHGNELSYLPGQRLSRCTCKGESHPGPIHADGTLVGRSAPEIDIFEAQISGQPLTGQVSQSAQWAPMNHGYIWYNTSQNQIIRNLSISQANTYVGGVEQQATSVVTQTDQNCYEHESGCFSIYGFEYMPGFDNAYITWISNNQVSWTLQAAGMAADPIVQISARPIAQEPMYIIMDLGMSHNFGLVDVVNLPFPVHMRVDYIRVYQPRNARNIGCDPKDFPTADYINTYIDAYTNPNYTTWSGDYGQKWPKNSMLGQCSS